MLGRFADHFSASPVAFDVVLPDKTLQRFGSAAPSFSVTVKTRKGLRAIRSIDEGQIGDAYLDGDIDIDGDMLRPFELRGAMKDFHPLVAAWRFIQPLLFGQIHTNKRAIGAHYRPDVLS
jgi:cyclopropane-fatty-acyl-phospholipid synthase